MLMCICYGVSCGEIKKMVCNGAHSIEAVQEKCSAGKGCGTCVQALCQMIQTESQLTLCCHSTELLGNSQSQFPE